jgi:hypothetical protein
VVEENYSFFFGGPDAGEVIEGFVYRRRCLERSLCVTGEPALLGIERCAKRR